MNNEQILSEALCKVKGYPYGIIIFPEILQDKRYYSTIFSHDFAKAFWGEEEVEFKGRTFEQYWKEEGDSLLHCGITKEDTESDWITEIPVEEAWVYHLKQMVRKKEPLKYLEKFLGA